MRNFTGTYHRPGRPRQLALCVQGVNESDRDYLMRRTELRNNCEGVHEVQAIQFFTDGCRDGTLLKHKLMRAEPETVAQMMAIADKYATAQASMRVPIRLDAEGRVISNEQPKKVDEGGAGSSKRHSHHHGKRKEPQAEEPAGSQQVAAVHEEQAAAGPNQR